MRLAVLVLLLLSPLAQAQYATTRTQSWTQALTTAVPNATTVGCVGGVQAIRGVQLDSVRRYVISVTAPVGNNFTAGYLRPYFFDPGTSLWLEMAEDAHYISATGATYAYISPQILPPQGCLYVRTDGVGLSGSGTTVTVSVTAYTGAP